MPEMTRDAIVAGVDLSESSRQAASWAAQEAVTQRLPLVLVHAFAWPLQALTPVYVPGGGGVVEPFEQVIRQQIDAIAHQCRHKAPELEVRSALVPGDPARVLEEHADNARLLVVGASGVRATQRGYIGSTAAEVLARRARVPVIVVRDETGEPRAEHAHVVVGVDGSPKCAPAIDFAYDFASRHRADLVAVHAWSDVPLDPFVRVEGWEVSVEQVRDEAGEILAESLAGHAERYPDVSVRRVVTPERPAEVLFDEAQGAGLLVVGSHGRGPIRRAALGSVSHAAVNQASCPVAVVPVV